MEEEKVNGMEYLMEQSKRKQMERDHNGKLVIAPPKHFGEYFASKRRKLNEQFKGKGGSKLLEGMAFGVSGRTTPSIMELRRLVTLHGGKWVQYHHYGKGIIMFADQLAEATKDKVDLTKVLKPQWLVDTIQQGILLPFHSYLCVSDQTPTEKAFLASYYDASRLHHLSTWRSEYIMVLNDYLLDHTTPSPTHHTPIYFHVDMDCFFASVALVLRPHLKGLPIAVSHCDSTRGSASISSSNYIARQMGIKNGISIYQGKQCCPDLVVVPYDFEAYERISLELYSILLSHTHSIEAVSCDEALLDVGHIDQDPIEIAGQMKQQIYEKTHCTASIGIGPNIALARLATYKAKPNGIYRMPAENPTSILHDMPIGRLRGIGWKMKKRLHGMGVTLIGDLYRFQCEELQTQFGNKLGKQMYDQSRGIDNTELKRYKQRQTVGTDVNWGIRVQKKEEVVSFLDQLVDEVGKRMKDVRVKGRRLSLKVRIRRPGAGAPDKFLGCGISDDISKSTKMSYVTDDVEVIRSYVHQFLKEMNVDPIEVRGAGLHITELSHYDKDGKPIVLPTTSHTLFTHPNPKKKITHRYIPVWDREKPTVSLPTPLTLDTSLVHRKYDHTFLRELEKRMMVGKPLSQVELHRIHLYQQQLEMEGYEDRVYDINQFLSLWAPSKASK